MFYARLVSVAVLSTVFFSFASSASDCHPVLWNEVKKLAQNCGSSTDCTDFRLTTEAQATFQIQGKIFEAVLSDSEDSDGGDLNDIVATSEDGECVLELKNVLAFGNLLQALSWIEISAERAAPESF